MDSKRLKKFKIRNLGFLVFSILFILFFILLLFFYIDKNSDIVDGKIISVVKGREFYFHEPVVEVKAEYVLDGKTMYLNQNFSAKDYINHDYSLLDSRKGQYVGSGRNRPYTSTWYDIKDLEKGDIVKINLNYYKGPTIDFEFRSMVYMLFFFFFGSIYLMFRYIQGKKKIAIYQEKLKNNL
jgi:hypothetical protein